MARELYDNVIERYSPKKGNGIIYCYTLDDGRQYIGQTTMTMGARHNQHVHSSRPFGELLRNHTFHIYIIGEYPIQLLDYKEEQFIKIFGTLYPDGCNKYSYATLTKFRDRGIGNISISQKKRHCVPCSVYKKGHEGTSIPQKVVCLETEVVYDSASQACNKNGLNIGAFQSALSRKHRCGGYHWVYYREDMDIHKELDNFHKYEVERSNKTIERRRINLIKNGNKNKIRIRCVETGEVFDSATDACKITGIDNSSISKVVKGKIPVAGGFHWEAI